jgi:hypothetical protein
LCYVESLRSWLLSVWFKIRHDFVDYQSYMGSSLRIWLFWRLFLDLCSYNLDSSVTPAFIKLLTEADVINCLPRLMVSKFKKMLFQIRIRVSLMKIEIKQKIDDKYILHSFSFNEPTFELLHLSYYIRDVFIIVSQTHIIHTWATKAVIHINLSWERGPVKCNLRFVTACSNFWSSGTSDLALSHLPCWRTYSFHARSLWQTYICLLLFV